jgi:hypothetical protein
VTILEFGIWILDRFDGGLRIEKTWKTKKRIAARLGVTQSADKVEA